jgi:20S proteasome alpha/beta subunit
MTIICALRCNDGIVIGSDGQASINTVGGAVKHQIQKIHKIGNGTIFAASGTIGLIQKCIEIVNNHSAELDLGLTYETLESIKSNIFPVVKNARDSYVQYNNTTEGIPKIDILLCGLDKEKQHKMWHMGADTHDEFIDAVGCYCSGNGETFGYALLKSLMQSSSNINSGKLIIYRTIRDTINSIAFGVGEPIDIWYLKGATTHNEISKNNVHMLSRDEIDTLINLYKKWKDIEATFLSKAEL